MTTERDPAPPPFADPVAEAEWQRQQRAWADFRDEAPAADVHERALLLALATDPAPPQLPPDFGVALEAHVMQPKRRPGAALDWSVAALAGTGLALASWVVLQRDPGLASALTSAWQASQLPTLGGPPGAAGREWLLLVAAVLAAAAFDPLRRFGKRGSGRTAGLPLRG